MHLDLSHYTDITASSENIAQSYEISSESPLAGNYMSQTFDVVDKLQQNVMVSVCNGGETGVSNNYWMCSVNVSLNTPGDLNLTIKLFLQFMERCKT